jgi:hypothetical protein
LKIIIVFIYRKLNITGCENISYVGVKCLCVGSALHLSREGFGVGLSNSLLALCAMGMSITHVGLQMMLDNVCSLRVCDLATVQNIMKIYKKKILNHNLDLPKNSPIYFKISRHIPYVPTALVFVVSLCPNVIKVEIDVVTGLTDSDLLGVLFLEIL